MAAAYKGMGTTMPKKAQEETERADLEERQMHAAKLRNHAEQIRQGGDEEGALKTEKLADQVEKSGLTGTAFRRLGFHAGEDAEKWLEPAQFAEEASKYWEKEIEKSPSIGNQAGLFAAELAKPFTAKINVLGPLAGRFSALARSVPKSLTQTLLRTAATTSNAALAAPMAESVGGELGRMSVEGADAGDIGRLLGESTLVLLGGHHAASELLTRPMPEVVPKLVEQLFGDTKPAFKPRAVENLTKLRDRIDEAIDAAIKEGAEEGAAALRAKKTELQTLIDEQSGVSKPVKDAGEAAQVFEDEAARKERTARSPQGAADLAEDLKRQEQGGQQELPFAAEPFDSTARKPSQPVPSEEAAAGMLSKESTAPVASRPARRGDVAEGQTDFARKLTQVFGGVEFTKTESGWVDPQGNSPPNAAVIRALDRRAEGATGITPPKENLLSTPVGEQAELPLAGETKTPSPKLNPAEQRVADIQARLDQPEVPEPQRPAETASQAEINAWQEQMKARSKDQRERAFAQENLREAVKRKAEFDRIEARDAGDNVGVQREQELREKSAGFGGEPEVVDTTRKPLARSARRGDVSQGQGELDLGSGKASLSEQVTNAPFTEGMGETEMQANLNARAAKQQGLKVRPEDARALQDVSRPEVDAATAEHQRFRVENATRDWLAKNPNANFPVSIFHDVNARVNGSDVQGFFHDGRVVLNAGSELLGEKFSAENLDRILRHEWAHETLSSDQGKAAFRKFVDDVLKNETSKIDLTDLSDRYGTKNHLVLLEEWIAKNAEKAPNVIHELVQRVRELLAKTGLVKMTDSEIANIMLRTLREETGERTFSQLSEGEKYSLGEKRFNLADDPNLNKKSKNETSILSREDGPIERARIASESRFYVSPAERGRDFERAIAQTARDHPRGSAVEVKPVEFYTDPENHLFLSEDGLAGAAVKPDGDLVSVFKHPDSKARISDILTDASKTATKLDAFDIDGFLPQYYAKFGFRPVARIAWDDNYAPPRWSYDNMGRPDVVLMVKDVDNVLGLPDSTEYNAAAKAKVPLVETYDKAAALQQEAVDKLKKGDDTKFSLTKTETPEFKRWFGDSQAVDKSGKPLRLLRGGEAGEAEQTSMIDRYYTTDPKLASYHAGMDWGGGVMEEGKAITPVYLKVENPYYIDDPWDIANHAFENKRKRLIAQGYDGVATRDKTTWYPFDVNAVSSYEVDRSPTNPQNTRVKSVYNVGTFDPENPDIRYSLGEKRPIPPDQEADLPMRLGTRAPDAVSSVERGHTHDTVVDLESMRRDPELTGKIEDTIRGTFKYLDLKDDPIKALVDHSKENLRFLYDQVPLEVREQTKRWYDGARKLTLEWEKQYDTPREVVAGVLAALSPQKDWFQNISLAERVLQIFKEQPNKGMMTPEMDSVMSGWVMRAKDGVEGRKLNKTERKRMGEDRPPQTLEAGGGESWVTSIVKSSEEKGALSDATRKAIDDSLIKMRRTPFSGLDTLEKAFWVRAFSEAHMPSDYHTYSPEGVKGPLSMTTKNEPAKVAWSGFNNEISAAISILENPTRENISTQLGDKHKVRNFYNNILLPDDPRFGDVTIDTHAVAAALLRPLSGTSIEVSQNFGTGGASGVVGVSGTYPIYAEAYRQLAKELGILPRELQSITWEAVRGLFPAELKGADSPLTHKTNQIWSQYGKGEITIKQAQHAISEIAGGVRIPEWLGPDFRVHESPKNTGKSGRLLSTEPTRLSRTPSGRGGGWVAPEFEGGVPSEVPAGELTVQPPTDTRRTSDRLFSRAEEESFSPRSGGTRKSTNRLLSTR
jgi:hypothetical protein